MENTLKQTLYVEFYGLPGCGKSTVSHLLADRLREEGFKVYEPSYGIDHQKPLWRKIRKCFLGLYYYIFYHGLYDAIKEIVSKNGYKDTDAFTQTVNIMQKVAAYRKNSEDQIVIWDQGIVQAAISLSLLGKETAKYNLHKLIALLPPSIRTHNVLIDIDENIALKRMALRSSNDSRVEKVKDENQKSLLLHRFHESICDIKKEFRGFELHGTLEIKEQTDVIYENIFDNYIKLF